MLVSNNRNYHRCKVSFGAVNACNYYLEEGSEDKMGTTYLKLPDIGYYDVGNEGLGKSGRYLKL